MARVGQSMSRWALRVLNAACRRVGVRGRGFAVNLPRHVLRLQIGKGARSVFLVIVVMQCQQLYVGSGPFNDGTLTIFATREDLSAGRESSSIDHVGVVR